MIAIQITMLTVQWEIRPLLNNLWTTYDHHAHSPNLESGQYGGNNLPWRRSALSEYTCDMRLFYVRKQNAFDLHAGIGIHTSYCLFFLPQWQILWNLPNWHYALKAGVIKKGIKMSHNCFLCFLFLFAENLSLFVNLYIDKTWSMQSYFRTTCCHFYPPVLIVLCDCVSNSSYYLWYVCHVLRAKSCNIGQNDFMVWFGLVCVV